MYHWLWHISLLASIPGRVCAPQENWRSPEWILKPQRPSMSQLWWDLMGAWPSTPKKKQLVMLGLPRAVSICQLNLRRVSGGKYGPIEHIVFESLEMLLDAVTRKTTAKLYSSDSKEASQLATSPESRGGGQTPTNTGTYRYNNHKIG